MKKLILLSILIGSSWNIFAQNAIKDSGQERPKDEIRTLMGSNHHSNGGYASFGAGYTIINDKDAATFNCRAAWIVGHSLAIGFSGTGFINSFTPGAEPDQVVNITGGYGGILFEPIVMPRFPVHLSFPMIGGVGGVAYTTSTQSSNSMHYYDTWVEDTYTYLIVEPGVELELNVLKFFRIAFGFSYRLTTKINWNYSQPSVLEGWNTGMSFKFGKF